MFTQYELEKYGNISLYESQLKTIEEYLEFHKQKWNHESTMALAVMRQAGVLKLGDGWGV